MKRGNRKRSRRSPRASSPRSITIGCSLHSRRITAAADSSSVCRCERRRSTWRPRQPAGLVRSARPQARVERNVAGAGSGVAVPLGRCGCGGRDLSRGSQSRIIRTPQVASIKDKFAAALRPHRELEPRLVVARCGSASRVRSSARGERRSRARVVRSARGSSAPTGDRRAVAAAQILAGNLPAAASKSARTPRRTRRAIERRSRWSKAMRSARSARGSDGARDRTESFAGAMESRARTPHARSRSRSGRDVRCDRHAWRAGVEHRSARSRRRAACRSWARHDAAWKKVKEAGMAMVAGGPPPLDQTSAFPGRAATLLLRCRAHRRLGRSRARAPNRSRQRSMQRSAAITSRSMRARIAAEPFTRRAPFAARYAAVRPWRAGCEGRGRTRQRSTRRAHADDILLGALLQVSPTDHVAPRRIFPELVSLAEATGNPWFALFAAQQKGAALRTWVISPAPSMCCTEAAAAVRARTVALPLHLRSISTWPTRTRMLSLPAAATDALTRVRTTAAGCREIQRTTRWVSAAQGRKR